MNETAEDLIESAIKAAVKEQGQSEKLANHILTLFQNMSMGNENNTSIRDTVQRIMDGIEIQEPGETS